VNVITCSIMCVGSVSGGARIRIRGGRAGQGVTPFNFYFFLFFFFIHEAGNSN
jgi:hypothetical protein